MSKSFSRVWYFYNTPFPHLCSSFRPFDMLRTGRPAVEPERRINGSLEFTAQLEAHLTIPVVFKRQAIAELLRPSSGLIQTHPQALLGHNHGM